VPLLFDPVLQLDQFGMQLIQLGLILLSGKFGLVCMIGIIKFFFWSWISSLPWRLLFNFGDLETKFFLQNGAVVS
jgi:hypothetical protein